MAQYNEWVRVSHAADKTTVTVTLVEDNLTAKWSVKCYTSTIKKGVAEARKLATSALADLREAMEGL
jgi:hypothetical protein